MLAPDNVSAESSYWRSWFPSANNSTYWTVYPKYSGSVTTAYGAQCAVDSYTQDLYTGSTSIIKYVETNDFTNPDWFGEETSEDGYSQWMPPANATITSVNVVMYFTSSRPVTHLYCSVNDKGSWHDSGPISSGLGLYVWNVTALESWTSAMLNSTDTWVKLKAWPSAGSHYYLDYLGFVVYFLAPYGGGDPIPEEPEEGPEDSGADYTVDMFLTGEGIIASLGIVGLIGMIATPALAVFVYRNNQGEGKMNIFVKMLVLFMLFLTFFMVSLG